MLPFIFPAGGSTVLVESECVGGGGLPTLPEQQGQAGVVGTVVAPADGGAGVMSGRAAGVAVPLASTSVHILNQVLDLSLVFF